ncbi:hypothetical protein OYT1_ch2340 [Ferriphaselus amnicola]|uniref:Uncharacterized protein n=1 Tax=Ferriphaselus amnicola TaxID=1188319 RepID=A0A2Z6GFD1_9PROT|nr:hypothetical protein OYT1_ch2340 [Ferriphaselus amnicola]
MADDRTSAKAAIQDGQPILSAMSWQAALEYTGYARQTLTEGEH